MTTTPERIERDSELLDRVTIRFAGDSGDGMQLTGTQFTRTAAVFGNDISTFPDYPAEIRAPAGSLPGVSGFQISFSASDIHTPGDAPDVLVAMNPAALKTNLLDLPRGRRRSSSTRTRSPPRNLAKAAYAANPLTDGSLKAYKVFEVPIGTLNAAGARGPGDDQQAGRPDEELLRPRPDVLALRAVDGAHARVDRPEVRQPARSSPRRTAGRSRPATPSARPPRCSTRPTGCRRRKLPPGHVPEHHRQRGDGPRLPRRRACRQARPVLRLLPDHAGLGHPPPARRLQVVRRHGRSRPRTRSPRSAPRSARRTAARSRSPARRARASRSRPRRWASRS